MVSSAKDFRLLWSPRIAFVVSSQGVRILTNSNVVVLPWKASSPDNIMASYKKALMETFIELVLRHGIVGFFVFVFLSDLFLHFFIFSWDFRVKNVTNTVPE